MFLKAIKDWVLNISGIFIIWIILHFVAANLYAKLCADFTIYGFIKSIFISEAPHCVALRWLIYNGGKAIHSMWVALAVWFTGKLITNMFRED
jgi:hypothetical protein